MATNRDHHLVLITRLCNCPLIPGRTRLGKGGRANRRSIRCKKKYRSTDFFEKRHPRFLAIVNTVYPVCIFGKGGILSTGNDLFATRPEFKLLSCIMHSEKVKQTTSEKLVRRSSKIDRMLIASNPKNRSSRSSRRKLYSKSFNPRVFYSVANRIIKQGEQ